MARAVAAEPATPFQELVAEEAITAIEDAGARDAGHPLGRFVDDEMALKLLLNVQKYSLWFHDFAHADIRKMQHGNAAGEHRLLVTYVLGPRTPRAALGRAFVADAVLSFSRA